MRGKREREKRKDCVYREEVDPARARIICKLFEMYLEKRKGILAYQIECQGLSLVRSFGGR